MTTTRRQITETAVNNWPYTLPTDTEGFIRLIETSKTFGNKFMDAAYEYGVQAGLAKLVAAKIKEAEQVDLGSLTALNAAGRCDRYLRENRVR